MITSNCELCNKEIIRNGNRAGRFCSLECKTKWQRTQKPVNKKWLEQKYLVEKLSTYEIGRLVKRDPKSVYRWLKDYEIPTRPRGQNLSEKDGYMLKPGTINPFKGRTHTEETKKTLSIKASVPKPWLRGPNNGMYGRTGESNPNFIDGSSPERQRVYASSKWKELIRRVYKRDNRKCVRCKAVHSTSNKLHIHHIKSWAGNPEFRFDFYNVILLCKSCHNWVHSAANTEKEYLS